jgi:signal transduction histidine kinase
MRKALLVSERGPLLSGLFAALGGPDLAVIAETSVAAAARRLRSERADLLLADFATLRVADRRQLPSLRANGGEARLLAVVPEDRPRLLREALRCAPDGVLLDPFDLAEGEQLVARLLAARPTTLAGHDSLDALATFLKGLAHEILNPLMSISGILQLLRKEPQAAAELKARYEAMWKGAERIHKTVRELEYFVRMRKPQRTRFDPAAFARDLVETWKTGEAPLQASLQAPESAPLVFGDPEQLSTALRHLVRFAAGADGRGAVSLELRVGPERVELEIRGGAAVKLPPRPADLMAPYQDVHGTGRSGSLELAAAYGIFRSHRGTIDVTATDEGGVRFLCALPLPPELHGDVDPAG